VNSVLRGAKVICVAGLALAASAVLNGQTAQLTGRVTDSTGAVVPLAQVAVKSVESAVETQTKTNAEGYFNFLSLLPGTYEVSVAKEGFRLWRQVNLKLAVQQVARLDLTLEVGSVSERVEVSDRQVLLDSETSSLGQVVAGRQITDLPLLGRNPYALALLVSGVRPTAGMNNVPIDVFSNQFASINGARANQNEFLLDGSPNSNPSWNGPSFFPNPDFVQEFKIETNNFSAEYGRAAGGVFNVVTRAGTNDIHFSLYEFLRNDKLNANDWFLNRSARPRSPFRLNQFGGSFGGPVVLPRLYNGRNRTFVFGNGEFVRLVQPDPVNTTVPDSRQLAGDFSATRSAAGQVIQVFDPFSTRRNPSGSGCVRTVFPGNVIPVSRFDPVSRNILEYYPAPNTAGQPLTGANNYVRANSDPTNKDTFSLRLDHYFSERHRLFGRFSFDNTSIVYKPTYGNDNIASPVPGPQYIHRRNAVAEDTYTITPSLLATVRASYSRSSNFRDPLSKGFDIGKLGFPQGLAQEMGEPFAFPVINVGGMGSLGMTTVIRSGMDTYALQGSVAKSLQRHNVKAGFESRVIRMHNYTYQDNGRSFTFSNAWTQGPDPNRASQTAGFGLASFLLGTPASGASQWPPAAALQSSYYAAYVQDTFRVTTRLTLNLGMRYDYESPYTDRFDQLTNFDYNLRPPLSVQGMDLKGALTFVGVGGVPRLLTDPDRNNFAPRLGFAFGATKTTVLRGGAGAFFAPATGGNGGSVTNYGSSGFAATTAMTTTLDGVSPLDTLRNPYPRGILRPSGSALGPATLLGQGIAFADRGSRTPYSGQWNFNIQQQLPGEMLFEVGYAGSRGLKFMMGSALNQLTDEALKLGDGLRTLVPNPFFGQIQEGALSQRTVSQAQLLRPYPHFQGVSANSSRGASEYHSLQVRLERRYARGLIVVGAYTFSKSMDIATSRWAGEDIGGGAIQNWHDLRSEWAISSLDQTHRLVVNSTYEIPIGKGLPGLAGKLVSGWQAAGIFSLTSGAPLGIASAANTTFSQGGSQRPNWTGVSTRLSDPTPSRWFDTSQFSAPEPYRFGNAPRNFADSRADGLVGLDVTASKTTRLTEKLGLQFRAEFFNLTNSPRFAPPNISFGNASFGVVSAQGNQPRIVQLSLKLIY